MYYLRGPVENILNILVLSSTQGQFECASLPDLKGRFQEFLRGFQPGVRHASPGEGPFVFDPTQDAELASVFRRRSVLDDRGQTEAMGEAIATERKLLMRASIEEGLAHIEGHAPELRQVFDLAIQTMFFFDSPTMSGGTNSEAVGVIWVNIKPHWSVPDVAEFLIHELTHTLIFIDELVHRHFHYASIAREENYALSAILGIRRPLDKVFHSIVVAHEILTAREQFLGDIATRVHPPSEVLRQRLLESLDSVHQLENVDELLTERGRCLVSEVAEKVGRIPVAV